MLTQVEQRMLQQLKQRQAAGLERQLHQLTTAQGTVVIRSGCRLINFSSNDYLSLANHPLLLEALAEGAKRYGVGSGASHLICGHSEAHQALEVALADWTGREAVLLFSSGYLANLALLTTLPAKQDRILQDKLNHASLIDGAKMSVANNRRYRHNDMVSLSQQLQGDYHHAWIVADGVFSMDGDMAAVPEIMSLAKENGAATIIDDAHGLGVLGEQGAGTLEHFGHSGQEADVLMGTLGKSLGTSGAFVAASQTAIDFLTQFARPYIYTTALSPALAYATLTSIQLARETEQRQKLQHNIEYFRQIASAYQLPLLESQTAIQPLMIEDDKLCVKIAEELSEQGFWVGASRPPTVAKNTARLRITLNSAHKKEHIEQLLGHTHQLINRYAAHLLDSTRQANTGAKVSCH